MTREARLRLKARQDLEDHFVYLSEEAGLKTADKFLEMAWESFELLSGHPGAGAPVKARSPLLRGLRRRRIKGFENYLIFYLPDSGGISILRVLHGARDWPRLLGV